MIPNTYQIQEEMIYIPKEYIDQNWSYRISGETIIITTNNQCYTQYNNTYCNCYTYLIKEDLMSDVYSCNIANNSTQTINVAKITSDPNYSNKIRNDYIQQNIIWIGVFIIGIVFAILLTKERSRL